MFFVRFIRKVLVQKDHTWREDIAYLVVKVHTSFHNILKYLCYNNIHFRVWIQEESLILNCRLDLRNLISEKQLLGPAKKRLSESTRAGLL